MEPNWQLLAFVPAEAVELPALPELALLEVEHVAGEAGEGRCAEAVHEDFEHCPVIWDCSWWQQGLALALELEQDDQNGGTSYYVAIYNVTYEVK